MQTTMGKIAWRTLLTFAMVISLYVTIFYFVLPQIITRPPGWQVHQSLQRTFSTHLWSLYIHIVPSVIAMALGPFQFLPNLRARRPRLHRWMGRIYLVSILIGGISGLYMAQFATGGLASMIGFAALAILWIFTGYKAYTAIRRGAVQEHRVWLIRNYALTFAAVTLRIYTRLFFLMGMTLPDFHSTNAWLCWVPNLLFAEWVISRTSKQRSENVALKSTAAVETA